MSGNSARERNPAERANGARPGPLATYALNESDVYDLAERGRLHAVLDAADAPDVLEFIVSEGVTAIELFSPDADPSLGLMGPYLVPLDEEVLARLRESAWRTEWGLLIEGEAPSAAVQRQLRRLLLVEHPAGKTVYFRMYDPRVLRRFLPSCTSRELARVFGPATAYIIADGAGGEGFTRYALGAIDFNEAGSGTSMTASAEDLAPRFILRGAHLDAFAAKQPADL